MKPGLETHRRYHRRLGWYNISCSGELITVCALVGNIKTTFKQNLDIILFVYIIHHSSNILIQKGHWVLWISRQSSSNHNKALNKLEF